MCSVGLIESITDDLELINRFHGADGLNAHKCYGYFASLHVGELCWSGTGASCSRSEPLRYALPGRNQQVNPAVFCAAFPGLIICDRPAGNR